MQQSTAVRVTPLGPRRRGGGAASRSTDSAIGAVAPALAVSTGVFAAVFRAARFFAAPCPATSVEAAALPAIVVFVVAVARPVVFAVAGLAAAGSTDLLAGVLRFVTVSGADLFGAGVFGASGFAAAVRSDRVRIRSTRARPSSSDGSSRTVASTFRDVVLIVASRFAGALPGARTTERAAGLVAGARLRVTGMLRGPRLRIAGSGDRLRCSWGPQSAETGTIAEVECAALSAGRTARDHDGVRRAPGLDLEIDQTRNQTNQITPRIRMARPVLTISSSSIEGPRSPCLASVAVVVSTCLGSLPAIKRLLLNHPLP
ncbi:hypothetical protein ACTZWT_10200 [Rhodopseudomonas sp. NSM]|uniref:hypothetical protein n=1 Tax=Rhodopseudomonas sp. NSM TaxID=3457630 RepID=UPI004037125E